MLQFQSPSDAETAFYRAFAKLDIEAMKRVWSEQTDIYCIHPGGGLIVGWRAVIESWRSIFHDASPPDIHYTLHQATRQSTLAVHLTEERIGPTAISLATNVFHSVDSGWRLVGHHASVQAKRRTRSVKQLH